MKRTIATVVAVACVGAGVVEARHYAAGRSHTVSLDQASVPQMSAPPPSTRSASASASARGSAAPHTAAATTHAATAHTLVKASPIPGPPVANAIFDDEFNGAAGGAPNTGLWKYDTGYGWDGGTTDQTYTDSRTNSSLDGSGDLVIDATADSSAQGGHTSARLQSIGTPFREGTALIIRAKIDAYEKGAWPAVWSIGEPESDWPTTGEADVFEDWWQDNSFTPEYVVHTVSSRKADTYPVADATQWHVYEARWVGSTMEFYLDGTQVGALAYVATAASSIILNVAVGGASGSVASPWHDYRMYLDYVRVLPA